MEPTLDYFHTRLKKNSFLLPNLDKPLKISPIYVRKAQLETSTWIRKHQPPIKSVTKIPPTLYSIIQQLTEKYQVSLLSLAEQLIHCGISSQPSLLFKVKNIKILSQIFPSNDIYSSSVPFEEIIQKIEGNKYTDNIMKSLNSIYEKPRSRSYTPHSNKRISSTSASILDHPRIIRFYTLDKMVATIKTWWQEILKEEKKFVSREKVAEKLIEKKVVKDYFEAYRMLGKTSEYGEEAFEKIFAEGILKTALFNLEKRLQGCPKSGYFTPNMELTSYKRELIVSQIRPFEVRIPKREGVSTYKAIEQYKKIIKSKLASDKSIDSSW